METPKMLVMINAGSNRKDGASALTPKEFRAMQLQISQAIESNLPVLEQIAAGQYLCEVWNERSCFALFKVDRARLSQYRALKTELSKIAKQYQQDSIALSKINTPQNQLIPAQP